MRTEQEKYDEMWTHPEYRNTAPGEMAVDHFISLAKPKFTDSLTDFGCGTGRAALRLSNYCHVKMLDFSSYSLDFDVRKQLDPDGRFTFRRCDLTKPIIQDKSEFTKYGFCCDLMEHIPPEDVKQTLINILYAARHVYFQISCQPDNMGKLIGEQLHLTVQPYEWWLALFTELKCNIHYSAGNENVCTFYVTRWADGKGIKGVATVNTDDEQIRKNVLVNMKLGLPEAKPYEQQDTELIILAGGPSLKDFIDEIKLNKRMGVPVVTVNGAYNWALENGIKPDVQIILDAREFNERFTQPITPSCQYLISSQCDPKVVAAIPTDQITLWHSGDSIIASVMEELNTPHDVFPVFGGMTVMLRALPLLLMLGYHRFCIYGFDSCIMGDEHHGYEQKENDYNVTLDVTCGGRVFKCQGWHVVQAHEFLELQPMIADFCEMDIKGDGLIAHIIKTGASFSHNLED